MPLIPNDLSLRLVLGLLAVLLFTAPSGRTYAQTRAFQMTLWAEGDAGPGVDTDIPVFHDGYPQPNGRSILIRFDLNRTASVGEYDWSRIAAVLIDEPYNDFKDLQGPCWSSANVAAVNARAQVLADRAAELRSVAPLTRFWVNLTKHQLDWVLDPQCSDEDLAPVNVSKPYIDVISVDIYDTPFDPGVKRYYDWLDAHRAKPDQQVALVPGTYYLVGGNAFDNVMRPLILPGYFDYANNANQNCNLPLGSRGLTGNFDGCRVWIVIGWLAFNWNAYKGLRDPTAASMAEIWQDTLALPLRADLAHQVTPGELLPTFLPLLLE